MGNGWTRCRYFRVCNLGLYQIMDVYPINLGSINKGVTLTVWTEGIKGKPYDLAILDRGTPNKVYYQRTLTDPKAVINLPLHSQRPVIVSNNRVITRVSQSKLKYPNIPYLDVATHKRPYSLDDIKLVPNPNIDSPARMFTNKPVIEFNPIKMDKMPIPIQMFIYCHELGHQYFNDEEKADRWATITFLNRGFNLSSAIYALTKVLNHSNQNIERMIKQDQLLQQLSKRYYG